MTILNQKKNKYNQNNNHQPKSTFEKNKKILVEKVNELFQKMEDHNLISSEQKKKIDKSLDLEDKLLKKKQKREEMTKVKSLKKSRKMKYTFFFILFIGLFGTSIAQEVTVYSYRQKFLVQPLLDLFTEKTKTKVNVLYASKGLVERIESEGRRSPVDVILTADIGITEELERKKLISPVKSKIINRNVPANFRSPNNEWFALTSRARVIYASKDRVPEGAVKNYEDLTDPKWKGKICIRSGYHPYNIALFASLIASRGESFTENWLRGLKNNLARKPQSNDRGQVKAINQGVCDLALGNTYYFGKMLTNYKNPEQIKWAESVYIIFPNQENRGSHLNVSTMALAKYSPHRKDAIKLMEFLTTELAQYKYAQENHEFPVNQNVPLSNLVKNFMGDFKRDPIDLDKISKNRKRATELVDKVNFDN